MDHDPMQVTRTYFLLLPFLRVFRALRWFILFSDATSYRTVFGNHPQSSAERTHVRIRGSGTKDFYGLALIGNVLDTRPCAGIVEYEPTDCAHGARRHAAHGKWMPRWPKNGQMLPFEPPLSAPKPPRRQRGLRVLRPRRAAAGSDA